MTNQEIEDAIKEYGDALSHISTSCSLEDHERFGKAEQALLRPECLFYLYKKMVKAFEEVASR